MDIEKIISDSESSCSDNDEPEPVKPIKEQKKSAIERPKRVLSEEQKLKMKLGREKKALERKSSKSAEEPAEEPRPKKVAPKLQDKPKLETTHITNNYYNEKTETKDVPKKEKKVKVPKEKKVAKPKVAKKPKIVITEKVEMNFS